MARSKKKTGVSLAKGPVALVGLALLAYGITAFLLGGHSFQAHPLGGTVNGKTWLGLEVNAWTSLLFIAAGALLVFAAPAHWAAKSMSLIVGLALGAAALIGLYDKTDVFGIFAANGPTKLAWGAAAIVLLLLSLLPRVGSSQRDDGTQTRRRQPERDIRREHATETEPAGQQRHTRAEREAAVATDRGSRSDSRNAAAAAAPREGRQADR
jgi:hypothetical protein